MSKPQSPLITLDEKEANALYNIVEHYEGDLWDVLDEDPKLKAVVERLKVKAQHIAKWHRNASQKELDEWYRRMEFVGSAL